MARQVDLSRLDDSLRSDRAPENGMGLSDLDGFLTGIAIGPELILPSEWLPHVWGGEEPVFESSAEAQAILSAIMARYNEILAAAQHGPGHLAPVFWVGPDGETVIAADWAEGFVDAMKLRAEAWLPLIQDSAAGVLLAPIVGLCVDEDGGPLLAHDGEETMAELVAEAPGTIPLCVAAIHAYWREQALLPSLSGPIRRGPKVGRIEPCPCG